MSLRIFGWTIAIYRTQIFTASGTWTKPKAVKIIWVGECRGGGPGGYSG